MEKDLFRKVYKQVSGLALKNCPPSSLSGLLHGYLSVYSMVRVYPWLEDEYGSLWDIHDRIREIARVIQELLKDRDLPVDTRAGYVVDLMDAYLLYSDMKFLDAALDAAYEILIPKGSDKMVLPCRTPNICRLLCNCYYLTGEEECIELMRRLVMEVLGYIRGGKQEVLQEWWEVLCLYRDVIEEMTLPPSERERLEGELIRLRVIVGQEENDRIDLFLQIGEDTGVELMVIVFDILARREFEKLNIMCGGKKV